MYMIRSYLSAIRILWRSASAIRPDDGRLKKVKFSAICDGGYTCHVFAHITGPGSQHYIDKFESPALDDLVPRMGFL